MLWSTELNKLFAEFDWPIIKIISEFFGHSTSVLSSKLLNLSGLKITFKFFDFLQALSIPVKPSKSSNIFNDNDEHLIELKLPIIPKIKKNKIKKNNNRIFI